MIELVNLRKKYLLNGHVKTVADGIFGVFPKGRSVALLGRNGAGKSTLLRMISGTERPTSGIINIEGRVSWPVGFAGSFHPDLTGEQNARFVARIYGVDTDELVAFVEDFAELEQHFHLPFRTYSSGMRSRLAFGVSMAVPFDVYLVDEVTSVGDALFREKSKRVFADRLSNSGAIVVSHSLGMVRDLCDAGAVLDQGRLTIFDNVEDAIYVHKDNIRRYKMGARLARP